MYCTSSLQAWHSSFPSTLAPSLVTYLPKPVSGKPRFLNIDSCLSTSGAGFYMVNEYDSSLFDIAESWFYPELLVCSLLVSGKEVKRFLVSPVNKISYDPHPIWLRSLGILKEPDHAFDCFLVNSSKPSGFALSCDLPDSVIHHSFDTTDRKFVSFGSLNYSHFLIDSIAEYSLVSSFSYLLKPLIFDIPRWAERISSSLGIGKVFSSDPVSRISISKLNNVIYSHVPSYQRRGLLARENLQTVSDLKRKNDPYSECCFLARTSTDLCRLANQPEVIDWCISKGISIAFFVAA